MLCLFSLYAKCAEVDLLMDAQAAMDNKEYHQASIILNQALDNGIVAEQLYYNLGYAELKMERIGPAIVSLERAYRMNPRDSRAKELLSVANDKIQIPVAEIPDFIGVQIYNRVARLASPQAWFILQFILIGALLYWIYIMLFRSRDGWLALFSIVFALISITALGYRSHHLQHRTDEVVYIETDIGAIREGADERSSKVTEISAGVKMRIIDEVGEWYKVMLSDKDIGWIQKKKVSII